MIFQGERVSHLPLSFSRFPFVRLTKWDNESVIVPRGAALLLLNDLLLANPVFAQPYPSHEPPLLLAAFPMSEQESPLDQDDSLWNDSNVSPLKRNRSLVLSEIFPPGPEDSSASRRVDASERIVVANRVWICGIGQA